MHRPLCPPNVKFLLIRAYYFLFLTVLLSRDTRISLGFYRMRQGQGCAGGTKDAQEGTAKVSILHLPAGDIRHGTQLLAILQDVYVS